MPPFKTRHRSLADLEAHCAQLQQLQRQLVSEKEFVAKENLQLRKMLKQLHRLPGLNGGTALADGGDNGVASLFRPVARVSVWLENMFPMR